MTQQHHHTGCPNSVTIVGFLQVFINVVDVNGNVYVTVMNVSGCGNGVGGAQPCSELLLCQCGSSRPYPQASEFAP